MAFYRWVSFSIVIFLLMIGISNGEIHRAKAVSLKTNKLKSKFLPTHAYDTEDRIRRHSDFLKVEPDEESEMNITLLEPTEGLHVWVYSIGGAVLVGLSGIFPLLVIPIEAGPALKHGAAASKLKLLLSFAVGGLLGDVFLHLLPEAWAHVYKGNDVHRCHINIGLWILAGLLSFFIIEKIFADEKDLEHLKDECDEINKVNSESIIVNKNTHKNDKKLMKERTDLKNNKTKHRKKNLPQHTQNGHGPVQHNTRGSKSNKNNKNENSDKESIRISGYLNLLANVIDNFTHGLAVAGSFLISTKVGLITLVAILVHEIPHEVGDFAILLRSGFDRWKAAKAQICTASGGVLGALTALTAESAQAAGDATAWVLPFTSGGFIYIALVTVVPDLLEERHWWESLKQLVCIVSGITSMFLVTVMFE